MTPSQPKPEPVKDERDWWPLRASPKEGWIGVNPLGVPWTRNSGEIAVYDSAKKAGKKCGWVVARAVRVRVTVEELQAHQQAQKDGEE